jgi:hypothetical protein
MVDSNSLSLDATAVNTSLVTPIIPVTTAATVDYCIHIRDSSKLENFPISTTQIMIAGTTTSTHWL